MMKSLNEVKLIGNLGRDPELRYTAGGEAIATLALATSSEWKDRETGEKQQNTDWHRCVAYGKLAELIIDFCRKGSTLYVQGKLRTRKWQDKEGRDQFTTEIVLDEFINFDKRPNDQLSSTSHSPIPKTTIRPENRSNAAI